MHPFTLHSLARGNSLKVFVTWTWKADCFRVFEPKTPQSSSPLQHLTPKSASVFFCLCNFWLQDRDEAWANWPLPVTSAGEVADVGLYARDVVSVFSQSASRSSTWSSWPGVVCAWEFSTRCCCALVCGVVFLYLLKKILGYLEMTLQMQISENRAIEGSNRAIEGCCVSSPGAQRSYRSFATWTMGCSNLFASCQGSAPLTPRACGFQRMGTSTRCTSSRQTFRTRA